MAWMNARRLSNEEMLMLDADVQPEIYLFFAACYCLSAKG
jgi:hypothetical protein